MVSQQAHDGKTTSYRRRCDDIASALKHCLRSISPAKTKRHYKVDATPTRRIDLDTSLFKRFLRLLGMRMAACFWKFFDTLL